MTSTPHGRVVAVTLTRELASGELITLPLTPDRIPNGVFVTTTTAILREKQATEQHQKRYIYHRPTHRS